MTWQQAIAAVWTAGGTYAWLRAWRTRSMVDDKLREAVAAKREASSDRQEAMFRLKRANSILEAARALHEEFSG